MRGQVPMAPRPGAGDCGGDAGAAAGGEEEYHGGRTGEDGGKEERAEGPDTKRGEAGGVD